jgi:hypothetical protein
MCARQDEAKASLCDRCTHCLILNPAREPSLRRSIVTPGGLRAEYAVHSYALPSCRGASKPVSLVTCASQSWRPPPLAYTVHVRTGICAFCFVVPTALNVCAGSGTRERSATAHHEPHARAPEKNCTLRRARHFLSHRP